MFYNTCLFARKALLTPTIEKIIFLSSTVAILFSYEYKLRVMKIHHRVHGVPLSYIFLHNCHQKKTLKTLCDSVSSVVQKLILFLFVREIVILHIFYILADGVGHHSMQICITTEETRTETIGHAKHV